MVNSDQLYRQAMNAGDGAAWEQDWNRAIAAYAQAIKSRPEDPLAHNSLGLALYQARRYEDALKVYSRAIELAPDDPVPQEKCADVLERLGRLQEAAQRYIAVADVYLAQRDLDKAIGNWERATRLTPGLVKIHYMLAQAYERTGLKRSAVREYLTLAFNFQRANDKTRALQAAQRAKRLEPASPQVDNAIQAIESGALMVLPEREEAESANGVESGSYEETPAPATDNPKGPLGEATEKALADLAELVFNDLTPATAFAVSGIESQKIGDYAEAAGSFKQAERSGMRSAAMYLCLGTCLVEAGEWDEAKKYFERVQSDKVYAPGAAHGIGRVYLGQHKSRQAAEQLLKALQMTDTSLAVSPQEVAELNGIYDPLLRSLDGMEEADIVSTADRFAKLLTGPEWKLRIVETRRSIKERITAEGGKAALDYYGTEQADIMVKIDSYIKQRLLVLAMDEAFRVIEKEPTFLPAHQRVAQILMEEGSTQPAIVKYNMVANSFLARNDTLRAAEILNEVIAVAPMDIDLRTSLLNLLEREEKWDKMIDEYVGLAKAYEGLASLEEARATYQEAIRLAQKTNAAPEKRAEIMNYVAEIDMNRLDLRQALRTYEQIKLLVPNDEKARRALVDLNYRLGNNLEAVKELDGLLRLLAQMKRGDQILSLLEQLVGQTPNDMALRSRLAAVYRQINRKADAIAQLDALGELQLEAGQYQDACATIKQIMTLQPNDIEQYKNLLSQLGC